MEAPNTPTDHPQISLQCFNGASAPAVVVQGWKLIVAFSDSVRQEFWELLNLAVMAPGEPSYQARLENFCKRHELEIEPSILALQACDFLIGNAAAHNLEPEALKPDLVALSGEPSPLVDEFQVYYQTVKPLIRNRLTETTLADHGKLLTGLDWRVDNVTASDRGTQLNTTVVYLTLHYRDGEDPGRVSLQLTPESLQQLKVFTDRFGG